MERDDAGEGVIAASLAPIDALASQWHAQIYQANHDAIVITDRAGRILDWNDAATRLFGYDRAAIVGQMADVLYTPEGAMRLAQAISAELLPATPWSGEIAIARRDGVARVCDITVTALVDARGAISGAFTTHRDNTERKRAEERARQAQEVAGRFAAAQTLTEVRGILLGDVVRILGGRAAGLRLIVGESLALDDYVQGAPLDADVLRRVARLPLAAEHPAAQAAREGQAIFLPAAQAILDRYPNLSEMVRHNHTEAIAHVPLRRGAEVFGVLSLDFAEPHFWDDAERAFALALADRTAIAFERARLFEAERDARLRLEEAQTRLEQALAEAADRAAELATVVETMPDAAALFDADGQVARVNAAFRALFDLEKHPDFFDRSVDERRRMLQLRDPAGAPLPTDYSPFERVLRRGETLTGAGAVDIQAVAPDGRVVDLEVVGSPVRGPDGRVTRGVLLYRDVTDRRRSERRAHAALEAFIAITRSLVEAPDDQAAQNASDADDTDESVIRRQYESPLARRLTELTRGILGCDIVAVTSAEEVDGRLYDWPVAIVGMPPDQERQWWAEQVAARPREVGIGLAPEDRARLLAGEVVFLNLTQAPYQNAPAYGVTTLLWTAMRAQGRIVGFIALNFTDPDGQPHTFSREEIQIAEAVARLGAIVLERDRLLRERAEAQARELAAVDAEQRMNEFLSIASHELRTPLMAIKVNAQLAVRRVASLQAAFATADAADDDRASRVPAQLRQLAQVLGAAVASIDRQERLVQDLLDVSRITAGKLEYRMADIDLAALTREVVAEQRLATPERAITEAIPKSPAHVSGDSDRIRQVIANYLTNALKYSPAEQPVAVKLVRQQGATPAGQSGAWRVEVQDAGPGIPPDLQGQLFERFYRAPGIEVQSGSGIGLGLGLYISKTIVEQHGGEVGVTSEPGQGSVFWFTLPHGASPS